MLKNNIDMENSNKNESDVENYLQFDGVTIKYEIIIIFIVIFLGIILFVFGIIENIKTKEFSNLFKFDKVEIDKPIKFSNIDSKINRLEKKSTQKILNESDEKDFYAPQKIKFNKNGNVNIGIFGDSMADGVWSGLYREIGAKNNGIYKFSTHSIGLTNYEYYDIAEKAKEAIEEKSIQIAIIMVGTNDQRGINGRGINVGYASSRWEKNYEARINELIKIFKDKNIAIYWVGLPKMRDEINDISASRLNKLFYKNAKLNNISFISTLKASTNQKGEFSVRLQLPNEKTPRNLRRSDGVHFEMDGYRLLAFPIINIINRDLAKFGKNLNSESEK